MSKPYDATAKSLLDLGPAGWLEFLGVPRPAAVLSVIDAELSTVTTAADKVIRVGDPDPWLLHLEFQAQHDASLPVRMLGYNALLQGRHKLPVATAVILLDSDAKGGVTGTHAVTPPFGPAWEFRYTVVRVWELSPDDILAGPLAVLPLAPAAAPRADVPGVVRRVEDRLAGESDPATVEKLWRSMGILMSLRFNAMDTAELIREFPELEKRPFFQFMAKLGMEKGMAEGMAAGRAAGRAEAARATILRLGRKRFGLPPAEVEAAVNAVADLARLEALTDRLLDVTSWAELLAQPDPA